MRSFHWLILLLFIILVGCREDPLQPLDQTWHPLFGSWDWVESDGGSIGWITPKIAGYTQMYRFGFDSLFYRYKNDSLIGTYRFYIKRDIAPPDELDTLDILHVELFPGRWIRYGIFFYYPDTVVLDQYCADCGRFKFARIYK